MTRPDQDASLRKIVTARTLEEMNAATRNGCRLLVRRIERNPEVHAHYKVVKHKQTGELVMVTDRRSEPVGRDWEDCIPWSEYYPYHSPLPFAAYILPPDLAVDETVFLSDLIEEHVGMIWGQGAAFRLAGCKARWTGREFELIRPRGGAPDRILG